MHKITMKFWMATKYSRMKNDENKNKVWQSGKYTPERETCEDKSWIETDCGGKRKHK